MVVKARYMPGFMHTPRQKGAEYDRCKASSVRWLDLEFVIAL